MVLPLVRAASVLRPLPGRGVPWGFTCCAWFAMCEKDGKTDKTSVDKCCGLTFLTLKKV